MVPVEKSAAFHWGYCSNINVWHISQRMTGSKESISLRGDTKKREKRLFPGMHQSSRCCELQPLHESFCSSSHTPVTLNSHSLSPSLFHYLVRKTQASMRTHTHKHLRNKSLSILLWTVNIFSRLRSLVETGAAASSPTAREIMSRSVSALWSATEKGTHPGSSGPTQNKVLFTEAVLPSSLHCVQCAARRTQYSPADSISTYTSPI